MDQDPKKFGYVIENKQWQSNDMNFQQAVKLVRSIYTDNRVLTKSKFAAATWIGRIINLGYSVEDIFDIINDTSKSARDINIKLREESDLRKKWYFDQLMKI
jgi:hypothetical protein